MRFHRPSCSSSGFWRQPHYFLASFDVHILLRLSSNKANFALLQQQFKGCTLDQTGAYLVLSQDIAMKTNSRWDPIYVLLGIYAFWTLLYLVALKFRSLRNTISPNSKIEFNVHRIVNPIHSQEAAQPVINGYNPAFTSPV